MAVIQVGTDSLGNQTPPLSILLQLESALGKRVTHIEEILGRNIAKGACRNKHYLISIDDKQLIAKFYSNPKSAQREIWCYGFFAETGIICLPRVFYADNLVLATEFVHSERYNLKEAIIDWAQVHSQTRTLSRNKLGKRDFSLEVMKIEREKAALGALSTPVLRQLSKGFNHELFTLVHGDLYENNILNKNGHNYYIDFENTGLFHPVSDLSLLLFNNPEGYTEIVETYRRSIAFDYPAIEGDIM